MDNTFNLFIAEVSFQGSAGSKKRPIVILEQISKTYFLYFPITTKFANRSPNIQKYYFPIKDWKASGLKRKSYIDTKNRRKIPRNFILKQRPIGSLTGNDQINLFNYLRKSTHSFTL